MRSRSLQHGVWAMAFGVSIAACYALPVVAQNEGVPPPEELLNAEGHRVMPEGWEQLSTADFLAQVKVFFTKPWPDPQQRDEVIDHIWKTLLTQESFVMNEEWAVVERLFKQVVTRKSNPPDPPGEAGRQTALNLFQQRVAAERASAEMDFAALDSSLLILSRLGLSEDEIAEVTSNWLRERELSQLELKFLPRLLQRLDVPLFDKGAGRAVYDGTITIPQAGSYTFSRYLNSGVYPNDYVVVVVGGTVVLDTRPNENGHAAVPGPVDLQAGAQSFSAEFYRSNESQVGANTEPAEHLLLWRSGNDTRVMIPSSAFSRPGSAGPGLRARYYLLGEQEAVSEEVVEAVDRTPGSIAHRYRSQLDAIVTYMATPALLAQWQTETQIDPATSSREFWNLISVPLSVSGAFQRSDLIAQICAQHPEWLGEAPPGRHMEAAMRALAAVPLDSDGSGAMVTLIKTWSANRPRYTTQIGACVGLRTDEYLELNDNPYERLGWMMGYYPATLPMILAVRDQSIVEADGACDLEVLRLYIDTLKVATDPRSIASASGISEVTAYVNQALENPELSADAKATWLVARGICEETSGVLKVPSPFRALKSLEQAFATAESEPVRLWALGEIMARLISLGESDRAISMLSSVEGQFSSEAAQESFAFWRAQAPVVAEAVAAGKVERLRQEDISRARGVVASLTKAIAELETIQDDPNHGDQARRTLAQARQELAAAQAQLLTLESQGTGQ